MPNKIKRYKVGVSYEATGAMFINTTSIEEAEKIAMKELENNGDEYIGIHTHRDYQTLGTTEVHEN